MAKDGLPSNVVAERSVLGAILMDNANIDLAREMIAVSDLLFASHQFVFRAMLYLAKKGQPIDYITVADVLERHRSLEAVGGHAFLTTLTDGLPRGINTAHYLGLVKDASIQRACLAAAQKVQESVMARMPSGEIVALAQREFFAIGNQEVGQSYELLRDIGMGRIDSLHEKRAEAKSTSAMMWGVEDVDDLVVTERQDLVVIGGRSGSGKSALALQLAEINSDAPYGRAGLIISLEMSKQQQFDRAISGYSGVPYSKLRRPSSLSDDDMAKVKEAWLSRLLKLRIGIADQSSMDVERMVTLARQFKHKEGDLHFLMVDHAQIVEHAANRMNRADELSNIMRDLKRAAKDLDAVVVVLSQVLKDDENREVRMSDLRGSAAIAENADVVVGVYRPYSFTMKDEDKGHEVLTILKNRQGDVGRVKVEMVAQTGRFRARSFENLDDPPPVDTARRPWKGRGR